MSEVNSIDAELAALGDEDLTTFLEESVEKEQADTVDAPEAVTEPAVEEKDNTAKELAEKQNISIEDAEKALKTGYNPDKYDPNDPESKSVREYNRIGEVLDKFETAVKDIHKKDEVINHLVEKFNKKEELAYQRALKDLEAKRNEAVEEGDVARFNQLDSEYKATQDEFQQLTQDVVAPTPAHDVQGVVEDFSRRNGTWYNRETFENSKMMDFAIDYDKFLTNKYPNRDVSENLKEVEMEVRKRFPTHPSFKNVERERAPTMSSNEDKRGSSSKPTVRDLTPFQRQVFSEIHKADSSYTVEKYLNEMG
jgi:hypothetical protein